MTKTKTYNKNPIVILSLLVLAFIFSCQNKAKPKDPDSTLWEAKLNEMLPATMIRSIKGRKLQASIPIIIKSDKGIPLENATFTLSDDSLIILNDITDKEGIVILRITPQLLNSNPTVSIRKESYLAKNIDYEVGGKTVTFTDLDEPTNVININKLNFVNKSDLKVYYIKDDSLNAKSYADTFLNNINFCREVLNSEDLYLIHPIIVHSSNITTVGENKNEVTMPINTSNLASVYWFYTHETVEHNLINNNNVYEKNKYLRYIGDGLAEWVSLNYLIKSKKEIDVQMINNRLNTIKNSEKYGFVVNEWAASEAGMIEGYSYSLAFWISFEKQFGKKAVQNFITYFMNTDEFDNNNISKLLEDAADSKDVLSFRINKEQAIDLLSTYKLEK